MLMRMFLNSIVRIKIMLTFQFQTFVKQDSFVKNESIYTNIDT